MSNSEPTPHSVSLNDEESLGARLWRLCRAQGKSRAQVADATGISASFLALVETGKSDITMGRLIKLIRCYGVRLSDLMPELEGPDPVVVVRRDEQRRLSSPEEDIHVHLLTVGSSNVMQPLKVVYEPGSKTDENWRRHEGEGFVHVLEGTIEFVVEGRPAITLSEGDTAYYRLDRFLYAENASERPASVIGVVAPPA